MLGQISVVGKGLLDIIHQWAYLCNITQSDFRGERYSLKQPLEVWIVLHLNATLSSGPPRRSVLFHKTRLRLQHQGGQGMRPVVAELVGLRR
jgi:hypothetical protein